MNADTATLAKLSEWAGLCGAPDPAPAGRAVIEVNVAALTRTADHCTLVAALIDDSHTVGLRARELLSLGWSQPRVHEAVATLQRAAAAVGEQARTQHELIDTLTRAAATSQAQVHDACRRAASEIASAAYRARSLGGTVSDATRRHVVMAAYRRISSAAHTLDAAARALVASMPPDPRDLVPTVAGIATPAARRVDHIDHVNRTAMEHDLASGDLQRTLLALGLERTMLAARRAGEPVELLAYHPDLASGQGGVALAIGDVAHADHVAVTVPGVMNSPADMSDASTLAAALNDAVETQAGVGSSSATVLWFDYDIPASWVHDPPDLSLSTMLQHVFSDSALALNAADAQDAAPRLAQFLTQLKTEIAPSASVTVLSHSYGSTVASEAATLLGPDAGIDDVILLASPGAGYDVDSADDYTAISPEHVYAEAFPHDPVPHDLTDIAAAGASGLLSMGNPVTTLTEAVDRIRHPSPFGVDPNDPEFGTEIIDAPSNVPHDGLVDLDQHALGNYLDGTSLDAIASVIAGHYSAVPTAEPGD